MLDPACGSGTFLLAAYDYLLRWYLGAYTADGAERWAAGRSPRLRRGPGGDWELTTAERKDILLRHIYGVDIDPRAVEVTKLSLLLKVLEGEPEGTLPDFTGNIRCGNALIEPDFYDHEQLRPDDENRPASTYSTGGVNSAASSPRRAASTRLSEIRRILTPRR